MFKVITRHDGKVIRTYHQTESAAEKRVVKLSEQAETAKIALYNPISRLVYLYWRRSDGHWKLSVYKQGEFTF